MTNALDRPARIGLITDQTGPLSFMGIANANVARMVVDDINAAGGLLGRPVELFIEDSATDDEVAEAVAAKLVERVGVDVVVNMLEPGPRKKVVMFGLLCGALFTFVVGTMGAKFVIELYPTDQVSPDMEMPRWIIFLCVPLGSYLMCFRFLQVAWAFWRTGELPHHDPGHVEGVVESPAAARDLAR